MRSSESMQASALSDAPKPQIMVNSMVGKMGQAVADATRRAGLELVPYTLCASDMAAANKHLMVEGQKIELVGPETRDEAIGAIKEKVCDKLLGRPQCSRIHM